METPKLIRDITTGRQHDRIAKDAGIKHASVRCQKCGAELTVDGGQCLAKGWPLCCGETMWLL